MSAQRGGVNRTMKPCAGRHTAYFLRTQDRSSVNFRHPSAAIAAILCACSARADWRIETGFTRLQTLAGAELPTAVSQGLTQVEALDPNNYAPDIESSLFSGKNFTIQSGVSGISGHANKVGTYFYATGSQLPGSSGVDIYSASDWLGSGFLNRGSTNLPASESRAVQNHSWISTAATDEDAAEANRRLDYAIQNQGFICVVGQNNGATNPLPQLLGQGYHSISVGRSDGQHSADFTTLDGTGRTKPDIVAPSAFPDDRTSWTTPMVAGAAGLLHAKVSAPPYSVAAASRPRVIKALLMASARKDNLPSWSNTSSRPLDSRYGAGNLNTHHAYLALRAGRAADSNSIAHGIRGWSDESVAEISSKTWFFTIPSGAPGTPFCAALTWQRVVTTSTSGNGRNETRSWDSTLANLDLRLHQANGFTLGNQIAASQSTVDNVELIHQPALPPGNYALVVQNTSATNTAIGLAWHSLPAATITTSSPLAREIAEQQGSITLTRSGDSTLPLWLPLNTSGTAVPGVHYQPLPASVMIPAGQSSVSLPVTPIADSLAQGDRTVIVAVGADFASVRDPAQNAVVTIEDKPFDAWRSAKFPDELDDPAISGGTADPDGDGLANLIEYALGLEPKQPDASPVIAGEIDGYLAISVSKNTSATDITWAAEVSDDLADWQPAIIETNDNFTFAARDTVPQNDAPQRFIRLKITRQ